MQKLTVYEIGSETYSRALIQFTKPNNLNYHNSTNDNYIVNVQLMSLTVVQSN